MIEEDDWEGDPDLMVNDKKIQERIKQNKQNQKLRVLIEKRIEEIRLHYKPLNLEEIDSTHIDLRLMMYLQKLLEESKNG